MNWNQEKKAERDRQNNREKFNLRAARMFEDWKKETKREARKSPSLKTLIEQLKKLRIKIGNLAVEFEVDPTDNATICLIDQKLFEMELMTPNTLTIGDRVIEFVTQQELESLEEVNAEFGKDGFVGLVINGGLLMAVFNSGDPATIGELSSIKGLPYPSLEMFQQAVGGKPENN